jgi:uncharacterized membrane protein YkvA (DUF1232 family)
VTPGGIIPAQHPAGQGGARLCLPASILKCSRLPRPRLSEDERVSLVTWAVLLGGVVLALYLVLVVFLYLAGRREARALAGFIPDCVILLRRLLGDPRVSASRKAILVLLVAYLATPIDLVPDFIPVAGQLDDVLIAACALRYALRAGGPDLLRQHWPCPGVSLGAVLRLAYRRGDPEVMEPTKEDREPTSKADTEA